MVNPAYTLICSPKLQIFETIANQYPMLYEVCFYYNFHQPHRLQCNSTAAVRNRWQNNAGRMDRQRHPS